ncbi:(Fe-S)-binding protein [Desulfovibrio psychrotolerans]|uniref:Glycolate oxidase n=1 Tax=Desulfovibrio psychrotolerans TaxID=415242 RepID=A0A7J0BT66_9BACT|nr:(Fe-S)-binding protein [Desulfovibrio psychrotolerans]GFM36907.1 glycolate oxidase [Desulfovibrio psychrotolerans]
MNPCTANPPARECILCGRCLSVCPVLLGTGREELSPKAKQHMLGTLARSPERLNVVDCRVLADKCLSCGRCAAACPQGLSVPEKLAQLRAAHPGWQQWIWKQWIERGAALWPALATFGKVAPKDLGPQTFSRFMDSIRAMAPANDIAPWLHVDSYDRGAGEGKTILLFAGCTARRIQKAWHAKALTILKKLGFSVLSENAMTCCGLSLDHAGIPHAAHTARQRNVDAWRNAGRPRMTTFCATCHHGLTAYAQCTDINWQEGEAQAFAESLVPLSTLWGNSVFRTGENAPARVRYHQPCHWGGTDPDRHWLARVLQARFSAPGGVQCCGMGGILQLGDQPLSRTVAERCWQALAPDEQTQVVTGCSGCTLQLRSSRPALGALPVPVGHWLDCLEP